nr:FtsK/SpoIIIE domain-containing protein [Neokomagataea anthophila]
MRRIVADVIGYLDNFEALPPEIKAAERYEFVVAANCPEASQYTPEVIRRLIDIGRAGPRAGRYLILHINVDAPLPHGVDLGALGDPHVIDLTKNQNTHADVPPSAALQQKILASIQSAKPQTRSAGFGDILPASDALWHGDATVRIETSLSGRNDGVRVTFGERERGTGIVHGVLAATAGAGKSNLLHALILGATATYSPEELQLYLLDLKQGVEFQSYRSLPHAAVVAFNSDPALARAVLSELKVEMERRFDTLFRPAGVQKLEEYRTAGSPYGPAPRILLIVDEYQVLFQDGDTTEVSDNLRQLSQQGRAAGVHMLLVSQTFRAQGMQFSEQIFNNVQLRLAMSLSAGTAQSLTEFEREGKALIRNCDAPGKVLVNDHAGRDGNNALGQVVHVTTEDREALLSEFGRLAATWPEEKRAQWPKTQLFDGNSAPPLAEMTLAQAMSRTGSALAASDLTALAALTAAQGGFDLPDWRAGDRPLPISLGRAYAMHGEALCVLGRLPAQNLLLLGSLSKTRANFLAGVIQSLKCLDVDTTGPILIIDGSGDPEIDALVASFGDRAQVLRNEADMTSALKNGEGHDVLLMLEPDRIGGFLRPTDVLRRSVLCDLLDQRLRDGPRAGQHTICLFSTLKAMENVVGRRGVSAFSWRGTTQVSREDSQDLLGSRLASSLERVGRGPRPALLADINNNRNTRFLPWDAVSSAPN